MPSLLTKKIPPENQGCGHWCENFLQFGAGATKRMCGTPKSPPRIHFVEWKQSVESQPSLLVGDRNVTPAGRNDHPRVIHDVTCQNGCNPLAEIEPGVRYRKGAGITRRGASRLRSARRMADGPSESRRRWPKRKGASPTRNGAGEAPFSMPCWPDSRQKPASEDGYALLSRV